MDVAQTHFSTSGLWGRFSGQGLGVQSFDLIELALIFYSNEMKVGEFARLPNNVDLCRPVCIAHRGSSHVARLDWQLLGRYDRVVTISQGYAARTAKPTSSDKCDC